jgi:hypothetical protein
VTLAHLPENPPVEPTRRMLDAYVDKLSALYECAKAVKFWKERKDKLQAELAELMGDATVGTVNGEDVLFYDFKEAFRGGDFQKEMPDTARFYTREVSRKTLDVEWLKVQRPELYEQYKVRAMRSTWEE